MRSSKAISKKEGKKKQQRATDEWKKKHKRHIHIHVNIKRSNASPHHRIVDCIYRKHERRVHRKKAHSAKKHITHFKKCTKSNAAHRKGVREREQKLYGNTKRIVGYRIQPQNLTQHIKKTY